MAFDFGRAANISTVVVAICLLTVTLSPLRPASPARVPAVADSSLVPGWEKYLVGGHSRGPATAPITILEFGDYECPFCAQFARKVDNILAAYPTQVRLVYRHWPLKMHRFAYPAARAAECAAAQDRFWEIHNLLYSKADSLGLLQFSEFATRAGVADLARFEACTSNKMQLQVVEDAIRDAHAAGGTGTPTVIVNGVLKRRGVDSAYVASLITKRDK